MLQSTKRLHKNLIEAQKVVSGYEAELRHIQRSCKHQFPKPPFYQGAGKTPKGMTRFTDSETCLLCGKDCHDPEEWK